MVFTDSGKNRIRDWFASLLNGAPTHGAFGSDGTIPTSADTALGSEHPTTRKTFTAVSTANKEIQFEHFLSSAEGNGLSLREFGIFNDPVAGTMFARNVFTLIAKDSTIEITTDQIIRIE